MLPITLEISIKSKPINHLKLFELQISLIQYLFKVITTHLLLNKFIFFKGLELFQLNLVEKLVILFKSFDFL